MLGVLGATKTFPHLLDDEGLRVRSGTLHDVLVPCDAVAGGSHA